MTGGDGCPLLSPASSPAINRASQCSAPFTPALRAPSRSGRPATGPHPRTISRGMATAWPAPPRAPRTPCTAHCGAGPSPRATSTWSLSAPGAVTGGTFSMPSWTPLASPKRRALHLPAHLPPTGRSTGSAGRPSTYEMAPGTALPSPPPLCRPAALLRLCASGHRASPASRGAGPGGMLLTPLPHWVPGPNPTPPDHSVGRPSPILAALRFAGKCCCSMGVGGSRAVGPAWARGGFWGYVAL